MEIHSPAGPRPQDQLILAKAWVGLGDVASWSDDYDTSIAAFRVARYHLRLVPQAGKVPPGPIQETTSSLARLVSERLQVDSHRLSLDRSVRG